jgi:hypothetical protein
LVAGVLSLGCWVAYQRSDDAALANFAGIWGLWVGLVSLAITGVGFALTILTMLQTQRIAREAQQQIQAAASHAERAVAEAHRQMQAAMERAATVLLLSEAERFIDLLDAAVRAGDHALWQLAIYNYQSGLSLLPRLTGNPRLEAGELADLHKSRAAITKVIAYIRGRLDRGDLSPYLRGSHAVTIPDMIQSVSGIPTRLHRSSLEVPNAP